MDPKTVFEPYPKPKNSTLGLQTIKNDPKIKLKPNIRIDGDIENESYITTCVDPKTVFEPYPKPKISQLGPQEVKNDPKIKSKSNFRNEGNKENLSMKIIVLYE